MHDIRVSENFVPVSEFKARAAEWLKTLATNDAPVVVTQNGRPAAVVLSPKAYDDLMERSRLAAVVESGLADLQAGRVVDGASARARLTARLAE